MKIAIKESSLLASLTSAIMLTPGVMAAPVNDGVIAAYTLVTPASESPSGLLARAILPAGADCPTLKTSFERGTQRIPTHVRPLPANTSPAFNQVTVCESATPSMPYAPKSGGIPFLPA